jgi:transcriptional regulator with XRE-family HTH domain
MTQDRRALQMTSDDPEPASAKVLPEQRVGTAMREARESARISLRDMAKRLGYNSHTTLSSHERGAVMPTDEAVTGYERVLDLTPGALTSVLEDARIERHGDVWAKRRLHLPSDFVGKDSGPPGSKRTERSPRWRRSRWLMIAAGAVILGSATFISVDLLVGSHKPAHAAASPVVGVQDGADPSVTGCATGAVTANSVNVYDPPEHLVGILQLRSSARCGTSWGRFVPSAALATKPTLTLEIDVYRPADGKAAKFRVAYDGLDAYGNMLISRNQCVYADLTLLSKAQTSPAPVQTACLKAPST